MFDSDLSFSCPIKLTDYCMIGYFSHIPEAYELYVEFILRGEKDYIFQVSFDLFEKKAYLEEIYNMDWDPLLDGNMNDFPRIRYDFSKIPEELAKQIERFVSD